MDKNFVYIKNEEIFENQLENFKYEYEVYEVLRVLNEKPLFLKEHNERLAKSLKIIGITKETFQTNIENSINKLCEIYKGIDFNIKIVLGIENEQIKDYFIIPIFPEYPPKSLYEEGIYVVTTLIERANPNAKIWDYEYKAYITKILEETKAYETILVDENGYMTEGSRSNIFFVYQNCIWTAPDDKVLKGVTRDKVIEVATKLGIQVIKENLNIEILEKCEGAFMTGTSVNILPIKKIDNQIFNSTELDIVKDLIRGFEAEFK